MTTNKTNTIMDMKNILVELRKQKEMYPEEAREYAITITELEKVFSYYKTFICDNKGY
jgi:hypothetical protein